MIMKNRTMEIEFERLVVEGQRRVDMIVGDLLVCTSADRYDKAAVQACKAELDKWNAEEPEKLERYTREELFELYNAKKDTLKRKVRDPFIDVKASLESVATAVLEREAAIFAQMSEEELVNKLEADTCLCFVRGWPGVIASVRQFDAAQKPQPQLGPGWRPMEELKGLRGDEEVLLIYSDYSCLTARVDDCQEYFDAALAWRIPTPTKAAELARTLDPKSYEELERLREMTTPRPIEDARSRDQPQRRLDDAE